MIQIKSNYHNTAVIYTVLQAIHNDDQLDQVDNDSNSRQVYLSNFLQHTVSVNNDLQPPVLNKFELIFVSHAFFIPCSRCSSSSCKFCSIRYSFSSFQICTIVIAEFICYGCCCCRFFFIFSLLRIMTTIV